MDKIFKQLYPGVKEEYLERAFERLKKNGCPADEDLMVWFGKLVAAEILEDALGNGKHDENNYPYIRPVYRRRPCTRRF